MKKFLRFAKKKAGAGGDRRSLSSFGSAASVDLGSSSEYGSVQNLPEGETLGYHVDLNTKDKKFTKLHRACWLSDLEKVRKLAKKDDVNRVDSEDRTPLHLACARGNKDVIWFLLGCKANLTPRDVDGFTPLLKAIECHHTNIVQFLLDRHADCNAANDNGDTGLHLAAKDNLQDVCTLLLQKGVNVDAPNKDGCTPLHLAIEHGHPELAESFLRHGASVNTQDNSLRTCLMLASQNGYASLITELLDYGANSALLDSHSRNAEMYAAKGGHDECVQLLQRSYKENSLLPGQSNRESSPLAVKRRADSASPTLRENDIQNHDDANSENSGSLQLDSWNDASDDEVQLRKKPLVPKLNLSKFMSSLDMSDKDASEMETDDLSEPLRPPPKPPRSMILSEIERPQPPPVSPKMTLTPKKVIPLMPSTGLDYDSDGQWDSEEEMVISAVKPLADEIADKTKDKEDASILSNLSVPSITSLGKRLPNEDDTDADISEKDMSKTVNRRNRPVPQPRQRSHAGSVISGIASPSLSESSLHVSHASAKAKKNNVLEEKSNVHSSSDWDSSINLEGGEQPVTVISIKENDKDMFTDPEMQVLSAIVVPSRGEGDALVSPAVGTSILGANAVLVSAGRDSTKSDQSVPVEEHVMPGMQNPTELIADSSGLLQVAEPKPRLYQKKGDNSVMRHRRTPSGNIIRDIHPTADTVISSVGILTDSDTDSNWSSSEDLPLTERKIQSPSGNKAAAAKEHAEYESSLHKDGGDDGSQPNLIESDMASEILAEVDAKKADSKESVAEISTLSTGSMLCMAEERDSLEADINLPVRDAFSDTLHAKEAVDMPPSASPMNVKRQISVESHTMFVDFQDEMSGSEWDNESIENVMTRLTKKTSLTSVASSKELPSPIEEPSEPILHEAVHSKTAGTPEPVVLEKAAVSHADGGRQLLTSQTDSDIDSGGDQGSRKLTGGNSTDGTLGRDGTLLGADEIWERNASLDLAAPVDNDSSSESVSLGLPPLTTSIDSNRGALVRQNAVTKEKTPAIGPGHVAAKKSLFEISPTPSVEGPVRSEKTEVRRKVGVSSLESPDVRRQFRAPSVDMSGADAGMMPSVQPLSTESASTTTKENNFPSLSSRRVSEMARQFESFHDDSFDSSDDPKPADKVKINRTFSVDTMALEKILKSKLQSETDAPSKPFGNKVDWQMPVDLPNKLPVISDRRHSVQLPMMTAPPGKSFKDILAERHNQSEHHSSGEVFENIQKAIGTKSDPGIKSQPFEGNYPPEHRTFKAKLAQVQSQSESDLESDAAADALSKESRKGSPKIGFGSRAKVANKFGKLSLKKNTIVKASEKQNGKLRLKKSVGKNALDSNNNKDKGKKGESTSVSTGKRRASTALTSSLERIAGLTKFTKRLSLSADQKSREALAAHMLRSKGSISSMSPEPQGFDSEEEQGDFVQEVLQRLDIRRRSSAGMLDSIPEALRQKKTSHTSSLEALSESTSSSDSESDIDDVFLDKSRSKARPSQNHAGDSLSDSDRQSDQELKTASLQISMTDWKDPQSVIIAQDLVKRLRVTMEKLKGENYILKERIKSITSERNDLQSKLENLEATHYSLQEKVVDLEAQVSSAQDDKYYADERLKSCESRLDSVSNSLQKKDEQLLAESCRRQQVELLHQTLQSETEGMRENIRVLTDCNQQLQNELSASKKEGMEARLNASPSTPDTPGWAALNLKNREMTTIHKQLDEATLLCKQVMSENQSLQLEVATLKQEIGQHEQQLAEQKKVSDEAQHQSGLELATLQRDLGASEEALKQTALQHLVQLNDLQAVNQQMRSQLDVETSKCSEMHKQISSLQSELQIAKSDVVSLQRRAEELDGKLVSQKDYYENKVTSLTRSMENVQKEKEELGRDLFASNGKVTHLKELLQAQKVVLEDAELHTQQSTQARETSNEFQKQMVKLQNDVEWVKQKLEKPADAHPVLENGSTNGFTTAALQHDAADVAQLTFSASPARRIFLVDQGVQAAIRNELCHDQQVQTSSLTDDMSAVDVKAQEMPVRGFWSPRNNNQRAALDKCHQRIESLENELLQRDTQIGHLEERALELVDLRAQIGSMQRSKQFTETKQQKMLKDLESREQQEAALEIQLHQTKSELLEMQTKMNALKSTLAAKKEVANKMDGEYEQLLSQLEEARNNTLLSRERERHAAAEQQHMEMQLQQTEQQVLELQAHFEETLEAKVALQNQFYKLETELRKANAGVQQEKSKTADLERRLQEKAKLCEDLEAQLQHAREDNSCLIEQLKKDVCDQRRLWETEARSRAELAARIWDMEQTKGQPQAPFDLESKITTQKAVNQREEVEKLLEKERERSSALQEQVTVLRQDAARITIPEVPAEITSRIKDLKKQTEDLRSRVKQEREQRRRAEVQLTKARQQQSTTQRIRKRNEYLEQCRAELRAELTALQHHVQTRCVDRHQFEALQQQYEVAANQELHYKLGQVQELLEEQTKAQEHLQQMRLNNEVQLRSDLQRSKNDLLAEVGQLRESLHQSQSHAESLQSQCDRLQELYNAEVRLRAHVTKDWTKSQATVTPKPFMLTTNNKLKHWTESLSATLPSTLPVFPQTVPLASSPVTPDNSMVHKIKAELEKSIQRHLANE